MTLTDGHYRIGPPSGRLLVRTGRSGLGRRAGHDLTIEATRWSADLTVVTADPGASSVTATVEADSLRVLEGSGGLKPLTDADRTQIERTLRGEALLDTAGHPLITFRSTRVGGTSRTFEVAGELTVTGRTQPVTIRGAVDDGDRLHGSATLAQSAWGIKPYTTFLGALRLADEVRIEFEAAAPEAG